MTPSFPTRRSSDLAFFIGEHDIMCLSVRHGPGCSPDAIRDLDPVPPSLHSNLGQAMTALIGAFINVQIIRELTLLRDAIAALTSEESRSGKVCVSKGSLRCWTLR